MEKANIGKVIKDLKEGKGVSYNQMANDLKVSTQTIQAWFTDKTEPTPRHIYRLAEYFNVHPSKFFGGHGVDIEPDYLNFKVVKISSKTLIYIGGNRFIMQVPLVEHSTYGGYLSGFSDQEFLSKLPKHTHIVDKVVDKAIIGDFRAFRVGNSSMDDGTSESIKSGYLVIGMEVNQDLWKNELNIAKWPTWIIVHEDGIIIKRIIEQDVENGVIKCKSINPDKEMFPDRKILLAECLQLFIVVNIEISSNN